MHGCWSFFSFPRNSPNGFRILRTAWFPRDAHTGCASKGPRPATTKRAKPYISQSLTGFRTKACVNWQLKSRVERLWRMSYRNLPEDSVLQVSPAEVRSEEHT